MSESQHLFSYALGEKEKIFTKIPPGEKSEEENRAILLGKLGGGGNLVKPYQNFIYIPDSPHIRTKWDVQTAEFSFNKINVFSYTEKILSAEKALLSFKLLLGNSTVALTILQLPIPKQEIKSGEIVATSSTKGIIFEPYISFSVVSNLQLGIEISLEFSGNRGAAAEGSAQIILPSFSFSFNQKF